MTKKENRESLLQEINKLSGAEYWIYSTNYQNPGRRYQLMDSRGSAVSLNYTAAEFEVFLQGVRKGLRIERKEEE